MTNFQLLLNTNVVIEDYIINNSVVSVVYTEVIFHVELTIIVAHVVNVSVH